MSEWRPAASQFQQLSIFVYALLKDPVRNQESATAYIPVQTFVTAWRESWNIVCVGENTWYIPVGIRVTPVYYVRALVVHKYSYNTIKI